jgi:hypothetical protein
VIDFVGNVYIGDSARLTTDAIAKAVPAAEPILLINGRVSNVVILFQVIQLLQTPNWESYVCKNKMWRINYDEQEEV